jgi:hypothetical protein
MADIDGWVSEQSPGDDEGTRRSGSGIHVVGRSDCAYAKAALTHARIVLHLGPAPARRGLERCSRGRACICRTTSPGATNRARLWVRLSIQPNDRRDEHGYWPEGDVRGHGVDAMRGDGARRYFGQPINMQHAQSAYVLNTGNSFVLADKQG